MSRDLPYKLTSDDVFITSGCTQAIDVALAMLARPGANILLPKPGFPIYELCSAFRNLEVRHFDLLQESGWEVDLDAVEALADQNTVAMVIINPGNPCGNVYSYQHLEKVSGLWSGFVRQYFTLRNHVFLLLEFIMVVTYCFLIAFRLQKLQRNLKFL